jgi:hypothetical protein
MRRALTKLLPEDHQSLETRSCKRRNNNERPSYQNVRGSFSSAAFFFCSVFAVARAAHYRSGWGVVSFVTSFYGNDRTKFRKHLDGDRPYFVIDRAAVNRVV